MQATESLLLRFMPTSYVAAGWCYILSAGLDAFDGHAARALDQSTKFGAMLDMLTDRYVRDVAGGGGGGGRH